MAATRRFITPHQPTTSTLHPLPLQIDGSQGKNSLTDEIFNSMMMAPGLDGENKRETLGEVEEGCGALFGGVREGGWRRGSTGGGG